MAASIERKLTTILAADAEGYSREMSTDEVRAYDALHTARGVFRKFIERHRGRIANTAGDGLIAEFPSVVEAVQCAIEVQRELGSNDHANAGNLRYRIGVHLGDVLIDGNDLLGEGVNLAARLQTMAEPGGILISQQVYDQVHSKLSVGFDYVGERRPKNFPEEVPVYSIELDSKPSAWPFASRSRKHSVPHAHAASHDQASAMPEVIRHQIPGRVRNLGIILAVLVVIDLFDGRSFWSHWPGLIIVALTLWAMAPNFASDRLPASTIRVAVLSTALVLANIFSWSGVVWAVWPAGALIIIEAFRRLFDRKAS